MEIPVLVKLISEKDSQTDTNPWLAMSGFLKDSPLADAWEQSMKEYRDEKDRLELVKD